MGALNTGFVLAMPRTVRTALPEFETVNLRSFVCPAGTLPKSRVSGDIPIAGPPATVPVPTPAALYRCTAFDADLVTSGGRPVYYLPIEPYRPMAIVSGDAIPRTAGDPGADWSGIQFATREAGCALRTLRGADLGQNLRIEADVRVPRDPHGYITQAGPYFRSRRAYAGDGILGGTSAGYWATLDSTGRVHVRCLNPNTTAAFSAPIDRFDDSARHQLAAEVAGGSLRVWVDRQPVAFDQAGRPVTQVAIPPLWRDRNLALGTNQGAAGIAFQCLGHRDCQGSESAANIRVTQLPGGGTDGQR